MHEDDHLTPPADAGRNLAPVERSIVVNGRPVHVVGDDVGHGQLVGLAHPLTPVEAGRSFAVTWRGGPAGSPEGIVSPLQRVPLADGQSFDVAITDKS